MRKYVRRPWVDRHGNLKKDKEIHQIGETWDHRTWDEFLKETVEVGRREKVFRDVKNIRFITASEAQSVYHSLGKKVRCDYLYEEMAKLNLIEQRIIYYRFWKNLQISEMVKELNIPRTTMKRKLTKILEKLKSGICCKVIDLNIEGILRSTPPPPERSEEST